MTEREDDDFGRSLAGLLHEQQPDLGGWELSGSSLARARVLRRRRAVAAGGVVTALVTAAAVIAGGFGAERLNAGPASPTYAFATPTGRSGDTTSELLDVTCRPTTTKVSATTVVVRSDGLHVRVTDESGLSGTYLNYTSQGAGGGDSVPVGTSTRVLLVPPGRVSLNCSYDSGATQATGADVTLADPGHYFRTTSLDDLGCRQLGGIPSWTIGLDGHGTTPDAAVEALVAKFPQGEKVAARRAQIGYIDAADISYLIERAGRPWATAVVNPDKERFTVKMDHLC